MSLVGDASVKFSRKALGFMKSLGILALGPRNWFSGLLNMLEGSCLLWRSTLRPIHFLWSDSMAFSGQQRVGNSWENGHNHDNHNHQSSLGASIVHWRWHGSVLEWNENIQ